MVDAPEQRITAEIVFTGRHFPVEEPRFTRRNGPRTFMDYTRLTQNGRYTGWIEVDGVREGVDGFVGTRDRSWGIRPVGARDSQETAPPAAAAVLLAVVPGQFRGRQLLLPHQRRRVRPPWNRRAVWAPDGPSATALADFDDAAVRRRLAAAARATPAWRR